MTSGRGAAADKRRTLTVVFATTLAGITVISLIAPAIPAMTADLGLTDLQAGLVISATAMPGIVFAPLAGALSDRIGRKPVIVTSLLIFGVAGGLSGLAPNFGSLLVLRLVQGVGAGGLINLSVTLIADNFRGARRAHWIGINAMVLTIGLSLNPQIGGLLALGGHWRRAFLPYWLALPVALFAIIRLHHTRPRRSHLGHYLRSTVRSAMRPRALTTWFCATMVFLLIFGVVLFLFVFKLADQFGLSSGWIGLYLGAGALVNAAAAALHGRLNTRFEPKWLIVSGLSAFAVGYVVMGWGSTLVAMGVAVFLFAAGEGLSIPTLQTISTNLAPDEHRGAIVAVFVGSARLGQTTGPILAGVLQPIVGINTAILMAAGLAAAFALSLVVVAPLTGFGARSTRPHGRDTST